jgi:hypothetical protein
MAYGFIPIAWRQVKVTFFPKPGKLDYTEAKAYRPISLSSFLLKTMEKLVDRHIRDGALRVYSLHRNQHAYQRGKSTETALHNVVTHAEYAIFSTEFFFITTLRGPNRKHRFQQYPYCMFINPLLNKRVLLLLRSCSFPREPACRVVRWRFDVS